jgi:hypothetical protein
MEYLPSLWTNSDVISTSFKLRQPVSQNTTVATNKKHEW